MPLIEPRYGVRHPYTAHDTHGEPAVERYEFFIEGMHCASCVTRIEDAIRRLAGIVDVRVNPGTSTAVIRYVPGQARPIEFRRAIERIGPYRAVQLEPRRGTSIAQTDYWARHEEPFKLRMAVSAIFAGIVATITLHLLPFGDHARVIAVTQWLLFGCASVIQWWGGWPFHVGAVASLRRRSADMNTLISLGSFAAYAASVVSTCAPEWLRWAGLEPQFYYETSSFIITFLLVGRWFEARAKRTAGDALQRLLRLQPPQARVLRGGRERRVPIEDVRVDDHFVLRPGDRVPVDGVIEEGHSYINAAAMTGESTPVDAGVGRSVLSGTQNLRGRLVCRATRVGRDTSLAQIFQLVEDAQSAKVPVQRLADRVAGVFVPVVIGIAAVTCLAWWIWGPEPRSVWAISRAVAVLIVACPCALGLATPLAIMVGVGRGAQQGILLRNPAALELAGKVTDIIFDKTGTVTTGRPQVAHVFGSDETQIHEWMTLAASAERASEHPLGEALVQWAHDRKLRLQEVTAFEALPGAGLRATVAGHQLLIGSVALLEQARVEWGVLRAEALTAERDGATPMAVAVDAHVRGVVTVTDAVKPDAAETILLLKRRGLRPHLVTGDHEPTARAVAGTLGITQVKAACSPQDKVAYLQALRQQGKIVAMVGDGINDAPALTHAHLAIAMGRSADVAAETGDILLLHHELKGVVRAIDLSRRMMRIIRQNLCWAFGYNVLMIPWAAGAFYPLWGTTLPPMLAGGAMAVSSLAVVLNSLRLKRG